MSLKKKIKRGFTLVEILIVVVILGILAAIVIPQFSQASSEANENRLKADLQTLRSQLQLYKVQHNDVLPADAAAFVQAMTQKDAQGYGPYMMKIPVNPFAPDKVDANGGTIDVGGTLGDDSAAWWYDPANCVIRPDDSQACADGTAHSAL